MDTGGCMNINLCNILDKQGETVSYLIISIDEEKSFDKIHPSHNKNIKQTRNRNYHTIIKVI
jgi:uncharacterized OsmC-like protein